MYIPNTKRFLFVSEIVSIIFTGIFFQPHVSSIINSHLNMTYKGVSNMFCVFNQTNKRNAENVHVCLLGVLKLISAEFPPPRMQCRRSDIITEQDLFFNHVLCTIGLRQTNISIGIKHKA